MRKSEVFMASVMGAATQKKITNETIAKELNMSIVTWCSRKKKPDTLTFEEIEKLSKLVCVPMERLLEGRVR